MVLASQALGVSVFGAPWSLPWPLPWGDRGTHLLQRLLCVCSICLLLLTHVSTDASTLS